MHSKFSVFVLLVALPMCLLAQPAGDGERTPGSQASEDHRVLVEIPQSVGARIRQEMRSHLNSVQALVTALGEQRLDDVAEIASEQLGSGMMRSHRNRGGGPGRYLPSAMRSIGRSMHSAADEMAAAAKAGNQAEAMRHLGRITAACSACHNSYRIR